MAKQLVNIGTTANDGTGDPIRDAFDKVNDNFTELYQALGDDTDLGFTLDSDGNIDITNNLNVSGGLTVTGNTTLNGETITIGDGSDGATTVNGATLTINPSTTVDDNLTVNGDFAVNTDTLFVDVSADAVGIGTDSPDDILHISASGGTRLRLESTDDSAIFTSYYRGSDRHAYTGFGGSNDIFRIMNEESAGQVRLGTNSTDRLIINSSGDVGIGVTSPSNPLHIYSATIDTVAKFESGDSSVAVSLEASDNSALLTTSGTDFLVKNDGSGNLRFFNNGSEGMRIDSAGNVGVGTTSPANNVHIKVDANGEGLTIQRASSASGAYADLMFSVSTSDSATPNAKIRAIRGTDYADTDISIITNSVERMRIDSSGIVTVDGHTHTAQGVQTITTTSGTINLDASTYGVFRLTSDLTGATTLNLQNMKDGQVIDITVSGSQTITLTSDDTSETFNKVGGVDYDGASDNHIQVICIDATDSAAIYNYTIGTFESDTTP